MMMKYKDLPKVELHLHLDCSLSYEVVKQLKPEISLETYQDTFIAPAKCLDLADFLTRALSGIALMQTKEQLHMVTLDLFRQLKKDNVLYAEIRFAPLEHLQQGLTPEEVIETVNQAAVKGIEETGVEAGIILCTLRHYSESQSMQVVKLVEQFKEAKVVGFDIAADEAGFPIDNHVSAFNYAREHGIQCTAHAGEAKGAESVWETLEHFGPSRIGHGVRSAEDQKLLDYLKEQHIHLEVCPTSNVQTNVIDAIHQHPADVIYRHGISMSINTDARTITNVTLDHEYQTLAENFGWEHVHFLKCNLEAVEHAFTSPEMKARLRKQLTEAYQLP
ncbi:MAG: adenosine deaminase [Chitinophagales bacterium]|nr:adenosine deaminase [Chitinophagales bacterium]